MTKRNFNIDGNHFEPPLREWSNIDLPPSQLKNGHSKMMSPKLLDSTSTNAFNTVCIQRSSSITRRIVLEPLMLSAFVIGGYAYRISKLVSHVRRSIS